MMLYPPMNGILVQRTANPAPPARLQQRHLNQIHITQFRLLSYCMLLKTLRRLLMLTTLQYRLLAIFSLTGRLIGVITSH
jgi:hypothetical protein